MQYISATKKHVTLARKTWGEAADDQVGLLAAGVAFYGFLAFVPLLAAIVLGYGVFANPGDVLRHMAAFEDVLPADVMSILQEQLQAVASGEQDRTILGLAVALFFAVFGAMKGAKAIIIALNIVHGEREMRGFVGQTATAVMITLALVATALLMMLAISALGYIETLLPSLPPIGLALIRAAFWLTAGISAGCGLALIYRYGPNRPHIDWRMLLPGALTAMIGFVLVSLGFGFYVANFGSYNATYGALGAVIVMLMWLYLSAYVLLLGAELNAARDLLSAERAQKVETAKT